MVTKASVVIKIRAGRPGFGSWQKQLATQQVWKLFPRVFYLFIFGPFYFALNSSDYIASNCKIISECCIGRDLKGSCRDLIDITITYFPGGLTKTTKTSERLTGLRAEILIRGPQIRRSANHATVGEEIYRMHVPDSCNLSKIFISN
jgi:hypothetical protein